MNSYIEIILRSGAVYIFMIIAVRIFGKKELSQLNITDLILILLISNAVQNAMVGPDTSLQGGLMAAFTLFCMNYIIKKVIFKNPRLEKLFEGEATVLVYKGKVNEVNLKNENISISELNAAIREHGVMSIDDVALAMFEQDGNISVVSNEFKHQSFHKPKKGLHTKLKRI